jgi:hypothetical protein
MFWSISLRLAACPIARTREHALTAAAQAGGLS